jgi:hypothetical protein
VRPGPAAGGASEYSSPMHRCRCWCSGLLKLSSAGATPGVDPRRPAREASAGCVRTVATEGANTPRPPSPRLRRSPRARRHHPGFPRRPRARPDDLLTWCRLEYAQRSFSGRCRTT